MALKFRVTTNDDINHISNGPNHLKQRKQLNKHLKNGSKSRGKNTHTKIGSEKKTGLILKTTNSI